MWPEAQARRQQRWLAMWRAVLFAAPLALYTATLQREVQPADSGEFQIVAHALGIAHPPGYPLFSILAWIFAQAPLGSLYARTSFLSALASAFTVVFVGSAVQRVIAQRNNAWIASLLGGTLAASLLALSTTFWAQATTTNIRSLTALFAALMLWLSARAATQPHASQWVGFAIVFGLGVGHHPSLAFSGLVIGGFLLAGLLRSRALNARAFATAAIALLLTQAVWIYLPLRDRPGVPFATGALSTAQGLINHILARGFAGDMFAFATPDALPDRLALAPGLMRFQFGEGLSWAALLGIFLALLQHLALASTWTLALLVHAFVTLTYRAPQTVEYAMPAWVTLSAVFGIGWGSLMSLQQAWMRLVGWIACGLLLMIAWGEGFARLPHYLAIAQDRSVHQRAETLLRAVPPASVILAQWHEVTPLWALQRIEGVRPDVLVEYVPPSGAQPYAETFVQRAAAFAASRPTFITSFFEEELTRAKLFTRPLPHISGWQVSAQPFSTTFGLSIGFGERWEVRALLSNPSTRIEAGAALLVDVSWRALDPRANAEDALTVRLMRPDGRLASNADTRLTPTHAGYAAKRLVLGVPLDLMPGRYAVLLGVYRQTARGFEAYRSDNGRDFEPVAVVEVVPQREPLPTQRSLELKLGPDAPTLVGVDYDTGLSNQLRLWTHWRLGEQAHEVIVRDAQGRPLAPPRLVPATPTTDAPAFASIPFDLAPASEIWLEGRRLPRFWQGERFVPFGNQIVLIGSSARRTPQRLVVSVEWLAARNLTSDYVVSVRAESEGIYRIHDGVPALGALPTLKWIRGARVSDPHPLPLEGYSGALRCSVVVYESSTRFVLPLLDERYEGIVTLPC
ncbi:MAG: DUF2723 domain-containing protein [Thermoflexales bacterium]|nr:DUF2723 domain-containing protein [Thermoflexales bacterium]